MKRKQTTPIDNKRAEKKQRTTPERTATAQRSVDILNEHIVPSELSHMMLAYALPDVTIFSNDYVFVAKLADGSVVTWGDAEYGGDIPQGVKENIEAGGGVDTIFSNGGAFAAKLNDGSVVTWGYAHHGGDIPPGVTENIEAGRGVDTIFSTSKAFAAKLLDGSVVTWGDAKYGGDIIQKVKDDIKAGGGVDTICSNGGAFATTLLDGSVVTWGNARWGGDIPQEVKDDIKAGGGVDTIFSTKTAFAAKLLDGSVVTWGEADDGGKIPPKVKDDIKAGRGVDTIFSTGFALAAKLNDGSVVTWGDAASGGDITQVKADIKAGGGVDTIFSTKIGAFAAKLNDSSFVTWGDEECGGNSSQVHGAIGLRGRVDTIFSNNGAFAAKLTDGRVVTWGEADYGGYIPQEVQENIEAGGGVDTIFSTGFAFAAKLNDGSVVTWGYDDAGDIPVSCQAELIRFITEPPAFSFKKCRNFKIVRRGTINSARLRESACDDDLLTSVQVIVKEFSCSFENETLLFRINPNKRYGCGSNGLVVHYIATSGFSDALYELCVKHTSDEEDTDIVRQYDGKVFCGQVPAKIIPFSEHQEHYHEIPVWYNDVASTVKVIAYAMPSYRGSLDDFEFKQMLSTATIARIVRELHRQLLCLREYKNCYMDIKPANVLYNLTDKDDVNSIVVTLGDLGSESISTFRCPFINGSQYPHCDEDGEFCREFNLILLLAMLTCSEVQFDALTWTKYSRANVPQLTERDVIEHAKLYVTTNFPQLADILVTWT